MLWTSSRLQLKDFTESFKSKLKELHLEIGQIDDENEYLTQEERFALYMRIRSLTELESLSIKFSHLDDCKCTELRMLIESMAGLPRLKKVCLDFQQCKSLTFSHEKVQNFAKKLKHLKHLEHLKFDFFGHVECCAKPIGEALRKLPNLVEVDFANSIILHADCLSSLSDLLTLSKPVYKLKLGHQKRTGGLTNCFKALGQICQQNKLKELSLEDFTIFDDEGLKILSEGLQHCHDMEALVLKLNDYFPVTEFSNVPLHVSKLTNLKTLHLQFKSMCFPIEEAIWDSITSSIPALTNLTRLQLKLDKIEASDKELLQLISATENLLNLEVLEIRLDNTQTSKRVINDATIIKLSKTLKRMKLLRKMKVTLTNQNINYSAQGLIYLFNVLSHLPRLAHVRLHLEDCTALSDSSALIIIHLFLKATHLEKFGFRLHSDEEECEELMDDLMDFLISTNRSVSIYLPN
jgi:hypothetical protein